MLCSVNSAATCRSKKLRFTYLGDAIHKPPVSRAHTLFRRKQLYPTGNHMIAAIQIFQTLWYAEELAGKEAHQ